MTDEDRQEIARDDILSDGWLDIFVRNLAPGEGAHGIDMQVAFSLLRQSVPDASDHELREAMLVGSTMFELMKRAPHVQSAISRFLPLADGLPGDLTIEEAAVIKARRGDPLAIELLARLAAPA